MVIGYHLRSPFSGYDPLKIGINRNFALYAVQVLAVVPPRFFEIENESGSAYFVADQGAYMLQPQLSKNKVVAQRTGPRYTVRFVKF